MEWTVEIDDVKALRLLECYLQSDVVSDTRGGGDNLKALVGRINGHKVEVFSNEHPPPHFRVSATGESANYRIENCEPTTPGLERHQRSIKRWHSMNKHLLIRMWNEMRPSDCPVGIYRSC